VAAAAIAVLAGEDDVEQESQAASWSAAWKNSYLRQLAKRAKRDYSSGSIAGRSVDGANLLSGGQSEWDEEQRSTVELVCNLQFTRRQQEVTDALETQDQ
jgi:hypothetical protein